MPTPIAEGAEVKEKEIKEGRKPVIIIACVYVTVHLVSSSFWFLTHVDLELFSIRRRTDE